MSFPVTLELASLGDLAMLDSALRAYARELFLRAASESPGNPDSDLFRRVDAVVRLSARVESLLADFSDECC